jgi:hypothetical protein
MKKPVDGAAFIWYPIKELNNKFINVSKILQLVEDIDHLFAIAACRRIGMMELWNNGILNDQKFSITYIFCRHNYFVIGFECLYKSPYPSNPTFQYSIPPLCQL